MFLINPYTPTPPTIPPLSILSLGYSVVCTRGQCQSQQQKHHTSIPRTIILPMSLPPTINRPQSNMTPTPSFRYQATLLLVQITSNQTTKKNNNMMIHHPDLILNNNSSYYSYPPLSSYEATYWTKLMMKITTKMEEEEEEEEDKGIPTSQVDMRYEK